MTIVENIKHTFAVSDLGDFDLDQDRSIVPSIKFALKNQGINADVDGEEFNGAVFYVHCQSPRDTVKKALEDEGLILEDD